MTQGQERLDRIVGHLVATLGSFVPTRHYLPRFVAEVRASLAAIEEDLPKPLAGDLLDACADLEYVNAILIHEARNQLTRSEVLDLSETIERMIRLLRSWRERTPAK